VDQDEACQGPRGVVTQYHISFQTEFVVETENLNITRCRAGWCRHTFEPPLNHSSNYNQISVAAVNVVGMGISRACTTHPISE